MVSIPEFASKIRKKNNGAYSGIDDAVLVEKYLEKHPVYRDRVQAAAPAPVLGQSISEPPPAVVPDASHPDPGAVPAYPPQSDMNALIAQPEEPVASSTGMVAGEPSAPATTPADISDPRRKVPVLVRPKNVAESPRVEQVEPDVARTAQGQIADVVMDPVEVRRPGARIEERGLEAVGEGFESGMTNLVSGSTRYVATKLRNTPQAPPEEMDADQRAIYDKGKTIAESGKKKLTAKEKLYRDTYRHNKTMQEWKGKGEELDAVADEIRAGLSEEATLTAQDAQEYLTGGDALNPANAAKTVLAGLVVTSEQLPNMMAAIGTFGAGVIAMEGGNWIDQAKDMGIDDPEILSKYGDAYGIPSGIIETGLQFLLTAPVRAALKTGGADKVLTRFVAKTAIRKLATLAGKTLGVAVMGGIEELAQENLSDLVMYVALTEAADKNPERAEELLRNRNNIDLNPVSKRKMDSLIIGSVAALGLGGASQFAAPGVAKAMQAGEKQTASTEIVAAPVPADVQPETSLTDETTTEEDVGATTEEDEPLSDEDKAKIDEFLTVDITKLAEKRAITQSPYTIENIAKQILEDTPSLTEEEAFDVADKTTRHPKTGLPGEAHLQSFMARPVKEGHVRMYAMRDGDHFDSWNAIPGAMHTGGDLAMERMQGTFNGDVVQNDGYEDFHIMGDEGAIGIEVPVNDAGQGVVDVLWHAKVATNNKPIRISDDVTLPLGVSIGVGETLAEADEALKQAKKSGNRNGIFVAESLKSKYTMSDRLGEDYTEQYRNAGMKIREEVKDAEQDVGREEDTGDEQGTGAPAPQAPAVTKAPASKAKAVGQRTEKAPAPKPVTPKPKSPVKQEAPKTPPVKKATAKPNVPVTPKPPSDQAGFITIAMPEIQTAKQRVPEGAKKAYKTHVQEKQVGLLESDRAINRVQQQVKGAEAEVIPFLIEGTRIPKELNRPDLEKVFNDPTKRKRLMGVAKEAQEHFHKGWERMQERLPDMSAAELENYVTHVWDIPKNNIKDAVNWFSTRNPLLKKRFIKTYADGIKRGYKPKTLDIAKLMRVHDQYAIKTTENIRLVEELKKLQDESGAKLIQRADQAPEDWIMSDHPVLRRAMFVPGQEQTLTKEGEPIYTKGTRVVVVGKQGPAKIVSVDEESGQAEVMFKTEDGTETFKVALDRVAPEKGTAKGTPASLIKVPVRYHPDLQPLMDAVFSTEAPARGFGANLVQLYDTGNAILKNLQMKASLFHHVALGEAAVATMGPEKTGKLMLNARKIFNAVAHKKFDIYEKEFETAKDGVKHGLQIGAITDAHRGKVDDILTNVRDALMKVHKYAGLPVEGIRVINGTLDSALWDYIHNGLKVGGYGTLTSRILARNTDPAKVDGIKEEVAQFINDTYGGQNWERMMTNPKTLRVFQRILLSPDWTVSTLRQAMSVTSMGAVSKEGRVLRMKMGAAFWASAAFWFGGGINLLNAAFTLWDDKEEKEKAGLKWNMKEAIKDGHHKFMWENDPGHKTHLFVGRYPDGSKRYVRWGKQFRELPEMFYDASAQELSPISATLKKMGGKTTPVLQLTSAVFTGYTPSGYKVKDIADNAGWSRIGAIAKHIVTSPIPFSLKSVTDETKEFNLSDLAFPSSKGMTYHKTRKMFKFALLKRKEKGVYNVFEAAVENDLDAYGILEDAIREIKSEAMSELSRDVRLGKTPGPEVDENGELVLDKDGAVKFPPETTVGQAEAWDKNQMRDAKKKAFLDNWETLLAAAKERYNAYLEEQKMLTSPLPVEKK